MLGDRHLGAGCLKESVAIKRKSLNSESESITQLCSIVTQLPRGLVSTKHLTPLLAALAAAWDKLEGGTETKMAEFKLIGRARELAWDPDKGCLSLEIIRHGAAHLGSSRAEVHRWSVYPFQCRSEHRQIRQQQIRPNASRLDVQPIVERIAAILRDADVSSAPGDIAPGIKRIGPYTIRISPAHFIPADVKPKQTLQGQRTRFGSDLIDGLAPDGWSYVRGRAGHTFQRG
jgi:hypothetical protein